MAKTILIRHDKEMYKTKTKAAILWKSRKLHEKLTPIIAY